MLIVHMSLHVLIGTSHWTTSNLTLQILALSLEYEGLDKGFPLVRMCKMFQNFVLHVEGTVAYLTGPSDEGQLDGLVAEGAVDYVFLHRGVDQGTESTLSGLDVLFQMRLTMSFCKVFD